VVHVEFRHGAERVGLVGHAGVDHLQHEHALARVRSHADPPVTDAQLRLGHGHQAAAGGGFLPGEGGADGPHDRSDFEPLRLCESLQQLKQRFIAPVFLALKHWRYRFQHSS